ncbi:hypothetical protein Tco_1541403 [Tanacetum coccineum]
MLELSKGSRVMKLTQLKKLEFFKEVKANLKNWFISIWIPMSPDNLKQPMEENKDDEPTKKGTGKRRKQIARKGFHTHHDKDETEDSDEANEKDNSTSGTKIPINHVPVATKSPSIANYKIYLCKDGRCIPECKGNGTVIGINKLWRQCLTEYQEIILQSFTDCYERNMYE